MQLRSNLVLVIVTSALCGQSLGFWPFSVFAESGHAPANAEAQVNKVAIIGMLLFF